MKTRISEIPLVGPRGRKELIKKIDEVSEDTNKKLEVLEETLGITLEPDIDEKYYQYFTIEATEDDTYLYFVNQYYVDEDKLEPLQIEVSWDDGATWTTKASENYRYDFSGQEGMPLARGEKLRIRGNNNAYGYYSKCEDTEVGRCFFWADKPCYVYGNIMSLIKKDNFSRLRKLDDYAFYSLFRDSDGDENHQAFWVMSSDESDKELLLPATILGKMCYYHLFTGSNITKAPKLPATTLAEQCYQLMFSNCTGLVTAPSLPATTLTYYCYDSMFFNCSSLTTAPELPATTLASACYRAMFQGCTNLTAAPELPAITLTESCYARMFYDCTSLTSAPTLPATTLDNYCYQGMFQGCTSLTKASELSARTLTSSCYSSMFYGCTSLAIAPELSATTLASNCYSQMFKGCTSLITAPALPVITLAESCYFSMFADCTNLTIPPQLPATTLVRSCYSAMFKDCTNLNYIKAMFTTTPSTTYTQNWVSGVAANGTFVKNSAAQWDVAGANGIPTGWTVETADN